MSRDRDRKLELALKHELRATGTPDREACVDAETLGAWEDGGLDPVQMASVELHVSTCARCQAIVGAAARSAPVIAPVTSEGWFRFPKWALAPLAAAAAITIWMVVPQDTMQAPPSRVQVDAPRADVSVADAPKKDAAPTGRDSAAQSQPKEKAAADAPPTGARAEKFAEAKRDRATVAPPALQDRDQRKEERAAATLGAAASAPPAAPSATPPAEPMLQKKLTFAPLVIESPDASRRWRIVNDAIERSEDGGASWIPIRTLLDQTITGGTAPTGSICWLIGSGGLVMVTADGITFAQVPLPERVDLTAITATDARSAIVTAADGRRFRTDDSGGTWRQI